MAQWWLGRQDTGCGIAKWVRLGVVVWSALSGSAFAVVDGEAGGTIAVDWNGHPGRALFEQHCATCHLGGMPKAPHLDSLRMMSPDAVLGALTDGVMKDMAKSLSASDRREVAEYLAGRRLTDTRQAPGAVMCTGAHRAFDLSRPPVAAGWGYDNRRFIDGRQAGLSKEDVPRLKLKWAFAFPSAVRARSQPVAAFGAVFVGSQDGSIYAFDLETGCARWQSKVSAEVRTAIVVEPWPAEGVPGRNPRLFFGDVLGRVYAMDALSGEVIWQSRSDAHPNATITGTPVPYGGLLYVPVSSLEVLAATNDAYACCTFRGSVMALDMDNGEVRWRHYTVETPPAVYGKTARGTDILGPSGAPVWNSPTIDARRGVLYHGSGENYSSPADRNSNTVFAVDLKTGARRWQYQTTAGDAWNMACLTGGRPGANCPAEKGPDFDIGASVILSELGGGKETLVAGAKSGELFGIDPDSGAGRWKIRLGQGSIFGGIHFGMAAEGARIYVPIVDNGLQADGRRSKGGKPGLHAVDAHDGAVLWSVADPVGDCRGRPGCSLGISAAVTAISGAVFAGHMSGWLRAYDGATGAVLWAFDTGATFPAVNGAMARGGSMSGPGVLVTDGHVVANSGYGFGGHMPGNALLVFTVDGR